MAEVAIGALVSGVAETLSRVLIQESAALSGIAREVERIERELRLMHAFLEHVEHHGEEGFDEWAEKVKDVARDAEDVIETFVIRSVKRRRIGPLYWYDRYKVGKQLQHISWRIRDIALRRIIYQQTNLAITVETPAPAAEASSSSSAPASSSRTSIVSPALEKLDHILTQNLITLEFGTIEIVEHVKRKLGELQAIVSNVGESSELEEKWLKEVKYVCDYTKAIAANFIARRERRRLVQVLSPFDSGMRYLFEMKFKMEMKHVMTRIGDAVYRGVTYGVGGEDMGDKIVLQRSSPVRSLSLERLIVAKLPFFIYLILLYFHIIGRRIAFVFFQIILTCEVVIIKGDPAFTQNRKKFLSTYLRLVLLNDGVMFVVSQAPSSHRYNIFLIILASLLYTIQGWVQSLFTSWDKNLESVRRDLALMSALVNEVQSSDQGLNERQKEWLAQMTMVAQYWQSAHERVDCFSMIKFRRDINGFLDEILTISDRKAIYGIANIQAGTTTRPLTSIGPSIQDNETDEFITVVDSTVMEEQQEHHHPAATSYRPMTGLRKKVESIRREMQMMLALFRDVQEIGQLDGRSSIWVEQMRGVSREIEAVINLYAAKLEEKPIHIHILNYRTRLVIDRKIYHIKSKLKDAYIRRKTYGLLPIFQTRAESSSIMVQVLRRRKQPSLLVKESTTIGMDDDIQVLLDQLLSNDERRCITSIVGIAGIGKTTLAHLVFDNSAVKDHFDCRIWVSVPPNCVIEKIVQYIAAEAAKQIMAGQQQDSWTTEEVLKTMASTRYLLVVEGTVDSHVLVETLEKTIPDVSTASRFVLISHNATVEQRAPGTRTFVHPLQLLDDQNSWMLFTRNLKLEVDIPQELIKVGKQIVIKCGGLPSEILKMSHLLSTKDVTYEDWSRVLEQLNQDQKPWLEMLNTVNMKLPLYLRRCLFYFLLFPADFAIPARRLVVLWVAEGLVHQGEHEEPPEEVAERYLAELIDLNMVQIAKRKPNGKVKICRIPNALRELWLAKANESRFLQVQGNTHNANDSDSITKISIIRRVADRLDKNDIWHNHIHNYNTSASASMSTYYKGVLSFLSFDTQEGNKPGQDIRDFLKRCISSNCFMQLRVLDLERVYKPRLPRSIARIFSLRYLGLRWTYLESLPSSISKLLKLQTLDLKHTYINTLTSSIWKMELRHLFLSETYRTRFPPLPKGISHSLSDLQTLWGLFVDEKTPVKGGLDRLVNIRKLGLACQCMSSQLEEMESQLEAVADWIMKLEHLQSLRLKSRDEKGHPWNLYLKSLENHTYLSEVYLLGRMSSSSVLSQFPPSLVELTLSHSKLEDDPMQILRDLPNLRSLCLFAESSTRKVMVCKAQSFPQLHVLKLWMLEQLEEWIIEQEALPCLTQLEIRSCLCMKIIKGLEHVNTLCEFKLKRMPHGLEHDTPPNCQLIKDKHPPPANDIPEGVTPCELYFPVPIHFAVSEGKVYNLTSDTRQSLPLPANHVRVGIEISIKGDHLLPVPNEDEQLLTIKDVIGTSVACPINLVGIDAEIIALSKENDNGVSGHMRKLQMELTNSEPNPPLQPIPTDPLDDNPNVRLEMKNVLISAPRETNQKELLKGASLKREKSTKRDLSYFEHVDSVVDSSSPSISFQDGKSEQKNLLLDMDHFPLEIHHYIENIVDVKKDGNCGFRVIASFLGIGEDGWHVIRNDLKEEMTNFRDFYIRLFGGEDQWNQLLNSLAISNGQSVGRDKWLKLPEMGHVIATKYNIMLVSLSRKDYGCWTFFPLRGVVPQPQSVHRECCIGFVNNNHFVRVFLKQGCPLPPTNEEWPKFCDYDESSWKNHYADRMLEFQQLFPHKPVVIG